MWIRHVLCLVGVLWMIGCGGAEADRSIPLANPLAPQDRAGGTSPVATETWTFIPIPGMRCANDTATGIGLNRTARSNHLFIYLEGGGGCWNAETCQDAFHVQNANLNGFDATTLKQIMISGAPQYKPPFPPGYGAMGVFDRSAAQNPLADYNFVYIPYCTADFHMGDRADSPATGLSHVGYVNMTRALAYLAAAFPPSLGGQVVLGGGSAGGFGALWNYPQTQAAFGAVPVILLDESGPPLPDPYLSAALEESWRLAWGLDRTRPAGAPSTRMFPVFQWIAQTYPANNLGLIAMTGDATLSLFLDVPLTGSESLSQGLSRLRQGMLPHPQVRLFYVWSVLHDYIHQPLSDWPVQWPPQADDGQSLISWMTRLVQ